MGGLANKMPVSGAASVIGLLSASGIPPLSGFWSKLIIVMALWGAGNIVYGTIALFAGVLTLGYLLYFQRLMFFGKLRAGLEDIKEAPVGLLVPQVALAAVILFLGIFFPLVMKWK
jgi:multicomponent Na+:H+ antiporter subunit D